MLVGEKVSAFTRIRNIFDPSYTKLATNVTGAFVSPGIPEWSSIGMISSADLHPVIKKNIRISDPVFIISMVLGIH